MTDILTKLRSMDDGFAFMNMEYPKTDTYKAATVREAIDVITALRDELEVHDRRWQDRQMTDAQLFSKLRRALQQNIDWADSAQNGPRREC